VASKKHLPAPGADHPSSGGQPSAVNLI
jgi:hypothetical protein